MQYRVGGFNLMPLVVKNLLIINGLFFLATLSLGGAFQINLIKVLGLHMPGSPDFEPYQFVSHMFMHANFSHIFFNMFALWMFGSAIENLMGSRRFLIYYLITGFGAAFLHLGVNYLEALSLRSELLAAGYSAADLKHYINTGSYRIIQGASESTMIAYLSRYFIPTVGASGAVFGILLAFGMFFPNSYIYLFFAIPVKAKYFVMGYGALELYFGITSDGNIAHFAHLGGMLFGFLLIRYWRRRRMIYY
ncbi:MAG: rhomboid family intramembrane serine protease [Bacteroidales bacterium]|nr:rhomboid family intramembrane serine protease [Bacteroidales bacterium]